MPTVYLALGYNSLWDMKMTQLNWVLTQFAEENKPIESEKKGKTMNGQDLMPKSFRK